MPVRFPSTVGVPRHFWVTLASCVLFWRGSALAQAPLRTVDTPPPARVVQRTPGPITSEEKAWWAFQPLRSSIPLPPKSGTWERNEIDAFVLDRLREAGLSPQPEASRQSLIRRLYLDLWGLPPSPLEVQRFVEDPASDAYEHLVDRLLAGSQYGERWARHWLDLVRYADSDGYRVDDYRPNAWRYRDYVIRALNSDKPYDRFVQEQLAGDELWPDDPDARIATGYLRAWIYEYNNRDAEAQLNTILNDITDTTADVFMGLGLQCARCHDHKFDPLLQKDYFRLRAFFAGIFAGEDAPIGSSSERSVYLERMALWEDKTRELRAVLSQIEAPYRRQASNELRSKFPVETQELMRKSTRERTPFEHQIAELAYRQVTYAYDRLTPRMKGKDKDAASLLRKQLSEFDALLPASLPHAMLISEVGPIAPPTFIPRKDPIPIEPGFPSVLDDAPATISPLASAPQSTGRRAALAKWLTQSTNPLSSRVMVNRVWQYHFGRGLSATSSDFGHLGEKPSHPDLLDWLANSFTKHGWSLKYLHRLLVTSATYRQSSLPPDASPGIRTLEARTKDERPNDWRRALAVDPENRLLWSAPTRRLDAEQIRDVLLDITGSLVPIRGGPAVDSSQFQRSIYTKILRNNRESFLDAFDSPQHFSSTPARDTTTTPVQSLMLINSPFMLQQAKAMAYRLERDLTGDVSAQIRRAYELAYGRAPLPAERVEAEAFVRHQQTLVDLELARSASAGFLADRIPFRDGKAAVISSKSSQKVLSVPMNSASVSSSDFTLEGYVYLRSLSEGNELRTLAARFGKDPSTPLWQLGVAGKKSEGKPASLVLRIQSSRAGKETQTVMVSSDLVVRPDRPLFLAVAVAWPEANDPSATFYLKDLSNDDEPMASSVVRFQTLRPESTFTELTLGGLRGGTASWDGMLDDLRFSDGALPSDDLLIHSQEPIQSRTVGFWRFEPKPGYFWDTSGRGHLIDPPVATQSIPLTAEALALADLCHGLLNSNEFLYVE